MIPPQPTTEAGLEAVLFDLDNTLVDDDANWRLSVSGTLSEVCARHHELDPERLRTAFLRVAGSVWEQIRHMEASPWGDMDDEGIVVDVWSATLSQVGIQNPETLHDAVSGYLRRRAGLSPPFEDASDCLGKLTATFKLGIVTNGKAVRQVPKLISSGLAPYFEVVTTTDVGSGKPHAAIFMHALQALGVRSRSTAFVGDSLDWDVGGANRAGLHSIWLNRKSANRRPDDPVPMAEVCSLSELPAVLSALQSN